MNCDLTDNCAAIRVAHKHTSRLIQAKVNNCDHNYHSHSDCNLSWVDMYPWSCLKHSVVLDPQQTWSLRVRLSRKKHNFKCVRLACKSICNVGKWNDVQFLRM